MGWQWFHKLGSPRWFYETSSRWMLWLVPLSAILLIAGAIWGLGFTPADARQGNSYRIIYIHVPGSAVSLAGYYVMAISGAIGLIWRMKLSFMVMKSAASIGAALTFVSLVTGAIWGKPTWGTWWEWDARITSMLVLFFLYVGVMALQNAYKNQDVADKVCAVLSLVGMVNIPIIYKSVDWWYTLHQPATLKFTEASSIHPSMAYPLLTMILAFYLVFACLLIANTRVEILWRERRTKWVKSLILDKS